jgi:hypothetical protein
MLHPENWKGQSFTDYDDIIEVVVYTDENTAIGSSDCQIIGIR